MDASEYKVRLDIFEGPLDLLLYLIKKDEVDIHNISITRITSQYLEYIDTFRLLNIDLAAEFVLIRSFFGQASHEVIGRWPLASAPAPAVVDMLAELANMPDLPAPPDE